MTVCGGWTLEQRKGPYRRAITLFCRAWSCPDCFPKRLRSLKAHAASGKPTTFITLTVNPREGQSATERAQELSDAWRIVVKRARRKFTKEPLEYLAVFEETKKGEPHLHILARAPYIPQNWLSEQMRELINAPIVDIRRVSSKRHAINYVAKYVGKGPKSFGSLKRYWSSSKYDPKPTKRERDEGAFPSLWQIIKRPLWWVVEDYQWAGMTCEVSKDTEHIFIDWANWSREQHWEKEIQWLALSLA